VSGNETFEPRHAVPKRPNRFAREREGSGAGTDHFVRIKNSELGDGEGDESDPWRVGRTRYSTPRRGAPSRL
jgi:hypothetical protein